MEECGGRKGNSYAARKWLKKREAAGLNSDHR
jgi:hypothetical protein